MKKIVAYFLAVSIYLGCCVSLVSCSKDDPLPDTPKGGDPTVNEWVEKTMRDNYLWNKEIPESGKLNFSSGAETFFYSLLSLKDGKTRPNRPHYYYSYIEKNKDYSKSTRSSIDPENTYGMEFVGFNMVDEVGKPLGYIWARILYVLPGSPAAEAGLKRGEWITGINGEDNIKSNSKYAELFTGGTTKLTIGRTNPRMVELKASRPVEDNPLFYHTVLPIGDKKIGYLVYNHFTTGPKDYKDRTYDEEMKKLFQDFNSQGVNEFVLDLRYNGGGYLISANVLAGLLVPEQSSKEILCISTNNKGSKSVNKFNSEGAVSRLNLNGNRLFVLTSSSTASASELVINGLKPFMNVVQIGDVTEGKNVGSVNFSDSKYEWDIQPITMRITSSKTDVDYSDGLQPDYFMDELDKNQNITDELLPFGDVNEFMLNKAIELITGKQPMPKSLLIPEQKQNRLLKNKSIDRHQSNGVLVTPDYMEKAFN